MASEKNLQELFHDTLKDIYFAEKKILSALPKMAKAARSEELKSAFQKHESQQQSMWHGLKRSLRRSTKNHVARHVMPLWELSKRARKS